MRALIGLPLLVIFVLAGAAFGLVGVAAAFVPLGNVALSGAACLGSLWASSQSFGVARAIAEAME